MWADYGCNGLYLDEQTSSYTVAHNVMVNCPTNIAQNQTGTNTITDNGSNPSGAQNTIAAAGIESTYADIKTLAIPRLRSDSHNSQDTAIGASSRAIVMEIGSRSHCWVQ